MSELKGKVVLLDFWTLGCINCQHIIPDLKRLEAEFGEALVVIGVHSGKYSTEHDDESIREAISRYGLHHPVVNDPGFAVWRTFGAQAWPTLVLIDPAGNLVGGHAGEGVYPLFQPIVQSLVREFDAKGAIVRSPIPLKLNATTASTVLSFPSKALADPAGGRLFIADAGHNRILIADLQGRLQRAIGSGKEGFADGGPAEAAFRQPQGLALSGDGTTLYVADTRNHAVRAVALSTGEVTTIAGTGAQLDRMPADGARARETALASPWDVLVDGGTLFIAMAGVHQIWALDLGSNAISVFAGTSREGIADGPRRSQATLAQPSELASDGRYLYWVDPESSSVRRVPLDRDSEAQVETLVGTGLFDFGADDGIGKAAKLQHAQGIAFADGHLYISDTYNHKIRSVELASRRVTTQAGSGDRGWADGSPPTARFDEPGGLTAAEGQLYVADTNNHLIRLVDSGTGRVTTLALSNIAAVTESSSPGTGLQVTLPAQDVSAAATTVRVRFSTPTGYHLNGQAPSRLAISSSDPGVIALAQAELSWNNDSTEVTIPVTATFHEGSTTVTATGLVYYCRTGAEALCFIEQLRMTLPVNVSARGLENEVTLDYALPAVDQPRS
jgi:sugar lactone lactonase YvrE/thiol-disulfide isomerase/thioredoxin